MQEMKEKRRRMREERRERDGEQKTIRKNSRVGEKRKKTREAKKLT